MAESVKSHGFWKGFVVAAIVAVVGVETFLLFALKEAGQEYKVQYGACEQQLAHFRTEGASKTAEAKALRAQQQQTQATEQEPTTGEAAKVLVKHGLKWAIHMSL